MKTSPFLLALTAATSYAAPAALAQNPVAPAVATAPAIEQSAPAQWELAPDFLRDRNRIVWSVPKENGAQEFFVTTTDGSGAPSDEIVSFPANNGPGYSTHTIRFDKSGALQALEVYDVFGNKPVLVMPIFNDGIIPIAVKNSFVSLESVVANKRLAKRTFALDFPQFKGTLTSDYDERGRRQRDILSADGAVRTINYIYDARGLSQITDGATITKIERDAGGKMRALSAIKNGLLTRSATPIKGDKGAIVGTRTADYASGILQEVNEVTQEGGAPNNRVSQTSSEATKFENGGQTTEKKFEFRLDISPPRTPAVVAVEVRKRTIYKSSVIATEEIYRDGVLTRRSEFNDNGVIAKTTDFNADGSVASELDASKSPYANGGIIRRSNP